MDEKRIRMAKQLIDFLSDRYSTPPLQQIRRALGYLAFI
jgi:hypothetical protein